MPVRAPKSHGSPYGFLDDDDPDLEDVIRRHAQATGQDPEQLLRAEVRRRETNQRNRLPRALRAAYGGGADEHRAAAPPARRRGTTPRPSATSGGRSSSSSSSLPTPTLTPPRRLTVADGSGFALGLLLYALGLNYLRYGPAGVTGWLSAKFLNKPVMLNAGGGDFARPPAAGGGGAGKKRVTSA